MQKVADVYYEGRSRDHSRRGPSGERYHFSRGAAGASDRGAGVYSVKDAMHFDKKGVFRVEWTGVGRVVKSSQSLESPTSDVEAMLVDMGYRAKQKLAKSLGLSAGGSEDELEERLRPAVEELQQQMEEL